MDWLRDMRDLSLSFLYSPNKILNSGVLYNGFPEPICLQRDWLIDWLILIGVHNCRGWQIWNLQNRLAGCTPRKMLMMQLKSEDVYRQNYLFLGELQSFFLLRSSTDWVKPTYIMENSLLYSESPDLNVNLSSNPESECLQGKKEELLQKVKEF